MTAYYITHRTSEGDPEVMALYSSKVNATIEKYGGTKIVRTGDFKIIEGDWDPDRMTIIAFHDMASLERWYDSPEYADLKAMRHSVMTSNAIAVEGI
ncbi:MAG: D-fructose-6-phosphate amidotransferase [Rhodospirillaceae bacterium]|nr:D-fructose-6-phosphate amidotransferase [Rhodospirillaceae bacterium]|tara:strand:- start:1823 stop:2113 length:291 start_codon:yes stop_codon:yes gene_type:complete